MKLQEYLPSSALQPQALRLGWDTEYQCQRRQQPWDSCQAARDPNVSIHQQMPYLGQHELGLLLILPLPLDRAITDLLPPESKCGPGRLNRMLPAATLTHQTWPLQKKSSLPEVIRCYPGARYLLLAMSDTWPLHSIHHPHNPWGEDSPCFVNKETEAQRGTITCSWPHGQ